MWKHLLLCIMLLLATVCAHAQADTSKRKLKDTLSLDEAVVTARVAIKTTKDTISYTVDSFNKNPDASTEDVLKRLPGIEVGSDGSIKVQGKPVAKLYINGKEYTADDLRTITQNMPADVLEKIQFADYFDEDAQFTGIKPNADRKIINLQFKKKYKGGMYGRTAAGYGTANRYQAGAFMNYMTDSIRITALANVSNTGISDVANGSGDNTRAGGRPQNGVNTRQGGNINFSYQRIKNLTLNGSYDISNSDNMLNQSLFRTTYLPGDSSLLRAQATVQSAQTQQHRLNLRSSYTINDRTTVQLDGGFSYRKALSDTKSQDTNAYQARDNISFRRDAQTNNNTDGIGFNAAGVYRKRFKKERRTLSVNASVTYNKDGLNGNNTNINQYYMPPSGGSTGFITTDDKHSLSTNVGIRYTEPLSKNQLLSLYYNNAFSYGQSDKLVFADSAGNRVKDTVQSREYLTRNTDNPIGFNYQYNNKKLTANAGLDLRPYNRHNETIPARNTLTGQKGINYAPNLSARYDAGKGRTISLSYNGNVATPSLTQLQPIPDYTDSLNIYIGNPNLRPEITHNISTSYNSYNTTRQRITMLQISANTTANKIISKTDINASRRITTPVNANGNYNLNASAGYTAPLFIKTLKASISLSGSYANNVSYTNGLLLNIASYNLGPTARLVYVGGKWYEGDLSYSYRTSIVRNPAAVSNNTLATHNMLHSGTVSLPWQVKFIYYINYTYNQGLAEGLQKDFMLVNASLDKAFTKPKGLTMKVQALDIFNNYPTITRNIGDNYFEDRSVNRVGSYYMFSLVYKFSYFPATGGKNK